jgi:hypothetical protein
MCYKDEIKSFVGVGVQIIEDCSTPCLEIDIESNPKCYYAIQQELLKSRVSRYTVQDAGKQPNFNLSSRTYKLTYNSKYLSIRKRDKKIDIKVFMESIDFLKLYIERIYKRHCSPENVTVFYTSDNSKWSFPIFRRPRCIQNTQITKSMKDVLENIVKFHESENEYYSHGYPFRYGCMLEGPQGIGKSTIIELVSILYNKNVYLASLNPRMSDAALITLISSIGPNSIIVFEEFEKQLWMVEENRDSLLSYGGILTAIDGPQRLSHGSIVILTLNDSSSINPCFKEKLLRKGRIDDHFLMKDDEKINYQLQGISQVRSAAKNEYMAVSHVWTGGLILGPVYSSVYQAANTCSWWYSSVCFEKRKDGEWIPIRNKYVPGDWRRKEYIIRCISPSGCHMYNISPTLTSGCLV